jgi:uncharacterized coiled-coil DUF342 family protein
MTTERWTDEMLDRLVGSISTLADVSEQNTEGISRLSNIAELHQQSLDMHQKNFNAVLGEIREIQGEIREIQGEIREIQTEVRGLQTENRRILDQLLNRNEENGA